jgi:hypothetical protein
MNTFEYSEARAQSAHQKTQERRYQHVYSADCGCEVCHPLVATNQRQARTEYSEEFEPDVLGEPVY